MAQVRETTPAEHPVPAVVRAASPLLRIHAAAHALYIIARVVQVLFEDERLRYGGYAAAFLMAGTAVVFITLSRRQLVFPFLLLLYLVFLAAYGLAEQTPRSYWQIDVASFITMLGIWVGARPGALRLVVRAYGVAIIVAAAIMSPLIFIRLRPASLGERFVGEGFRFLGASTLMPSLFLVFYQVHLGRVSRYATYVGLAAQSLFGLITASRGMALLPVASVAGHAAFLRGGGVSGVRRWLATGLLAGAIALTVWSPEALDRAWQNTVTRIEAEDDFWSGRKMEAQFLLEELTSSEMVVGRGFGGSLPWIFGKGRDDAAELMNMVHYGHYHLILKGGLILLALVALLMLAVMIRALRSRDPTLRAHGLTMVVFAATNLAHTQFVYGSLLPFFWLAIGNALVQPDRAHPAAGTEAPAGS